MSRAGQRLIVAAKEMQQLVRDKYSVDDYPDACDFLAREVFDVPLQQPVGFVIHRKDRIRVKAPSRPHEPKQD